VIETEADNKEPPKKPELKVITGKIELVKMMSEILPKPPAPDPVTPVLAADLAQISFDKVKEISMQEVSVTILDGNEKTSNSVKIPVLESNVESADLSSNEEIAKNDALLGEMVGDESSPNNSQKTG
tara:strand:- start:129 stop:509 length:381 start_codon:yes stop_codon:yes gene_type:complete